MKKLGNAKVVTGKYTDKEGKERNSYAFVGTLFQREDGSFGLKVDTLPVGQAALNWDGWINVWTESEDKEGIPF